MPRTASAPPGDRREPPPAPEIVGYTVYTGDPECESGFCLACADGDALCDGVAVYADDEGRPLRRCACCGAPL